MNRERLLNALNQVKYGLAGKEIIEQSTSFMFRKGRVRTYNDEITASAPVEIKLEGVVPAEEFLQVLSKLKEEEVDIKLGEGEIQIISGKFKAGIRIAEEIKLPLDEIILPEKWKVLPKGFKEGLKFCLFSVSEDMSRPILCCIHIRQDVMESCDNYRLTQYKMETEISKPLKLPVKAAKILLGLELDGYNAGEGWVHFKTSAGVIISFRTIEEEYPNLSKFIDFGKKSSVFSFPEDMGAMGERVNSLAQQDLTGNSYLGVKFSNGVMSLRGEGDVGWAEENKEVDIKEEIEFRINPGFLREILSYTHKATIDEDKKRLKFRGLGFVYILALAAHTG